MCLPFGVSSICVEATQVTRDIKDASRAYRCSVLGDVLQRCVGFRARSGLYGVIPPSLAKHAIAAIQTCRDTRIASRMKQTQNIPPPLIPPTKHGGYEAVWLAL